jgi:hypothetical protein
VIAVMKACRSVQGWANFLAVHLWERRRGRPRIRSKALELQQRPARRRAVVHHNASYYSPHSPFSSPHHYNSRQWAPPAPVKLLIRRTATGSIRIPPNKLSDLQVRHFGTSCARGIERHQQDAMKGRLRRIDQTCYFFRTEHLRQVQNLLRVWGLCDAPAFFKTCA